MDKITKPSKRFASLFKLLFYAYPVAVLLLWLFCNMTVEGDFQLGINTSGPDANSEMLDPKLWQRLLGFCSAMLPGAALMYIFHALSRLFSLYSRTVIFEKANVDCFRAVAWGLIAQQVLSIPAATLTTLILTITYPEGERLITVSVFGVNIMLIVVGVMILLVSRIMNEGRKMRDEQILTV